MNLAALGTLLGVASHEEVLGQCGRRHHESESGESGVWDVPVAVANALSKQDDLEPIAERWVETEELRRDGWRKDDGLRVLTELAELLSHQERGQLLWYWWSL